MAPSTKSTANSLPLDPMTHVISGFRVPGVQNSRSQNTVFSGSRTPKHRNVETPLHQYFVFRNFGVSYVKCPKSLSMGMSKPRSPKCQNATSRIFWVSQLQGFQCKGPWLLVIKISGILNPELPKSQNSTLNNPFRDLGVRVTKDFGLHSGLTNFESPK
jgi:hypothetical protein